MGGDRGEIAEMIQHGMIGREVDPRGNGRMNRRDLDPVELNAAVPPDELHARQRPHEVEMPEAAPELAVGDRREPHTLLHPDHVLDGLVLHRAQRLGGGEPVRSQRFGIVALPGGVHDRWSQQAPHVVRPKRGVARHLDSRAA